MIYKFIFFSNIWLIFNNQVYNDLTNETYIDSIAKKISDKNTYPSTFYGGATFKKDSGTGKLFSIF